MSERQSAMMDSVPRTLGRLRVALNDSFARASKEVGLTPQQAELLCHAFEARSISELAGLMNCDRSNVSHLVDRAASRNLLRRRVDDEDGRVNRVSLTDEGDAVATDFLRRLEALTAELRAGWSPERTATANAILTEVAVSLERPRGRQRHIG
jgi:DNA-binding MarR family transcriptional regulator